MPLKKFTLKSQVVTNLFLGGSAPRSTEEGETGVIELRPPSFRGALRYWLRALLGGVYGDSPAGRALVAQQEALVFGSTENESGGAGSVGLRIGNANITKTTFHRDQIGTNYLLWSMAAFGNALPRYYIEADSTFDLILSLRPGQPEQSLRLAVAALWLLTNLGGVGSRSRRTAGSFSPLETVSYDGLSFNMPGTTLQEISDYLQQGLKTIRGWVGAPAISFSAFSEFDILHPQSCRIWILGIWDKAKEAVEEIGATFRASRSYTNPDHDRVLAWLSSGVAIPTVTRSIYGLPIPYQYSRGGPAAIIQECIFCQTMIIKSLIVAHLHCG